MCLNSCNTKHHYKLATIMLLFQNAKDDTTKLNCTIKLERILLLPNFLKLSSIYRRFLLKSPY